MRAESACRSVWRQTRGLVWRQTRGLAPDARFGARRVLRPGGKRAGERVCSQIIAITAGIRSTSYPIIFSPLMSTSVSFLLEAHLVSGRILPQGCSAGEGSVLPNIESITGGRTGPIPPLSPSHVQLTYLFYGSLGPTSAPSRPLHLSILWVAWTNLSPHVHSTCLFFGSRGPTSALTSTPPVYSLGRVDQPRLFRSVSQTCPYCRQECGFSRQLVKGVKGNEALWSPPAPTQKNPPVRDKREFF